MGLSRHPQILHGGLHVTQSLFCAIKNPLFAGGGFSVLQAYRWSTNKESDDDLLSQAQCLLSLARERFTVLFGMGRGGSTLLWSSDKGVRIKANLLVVPGPNIRIVWGALRSCDRRANCFMSRRVYLINTSGVSGRRFNALSLYRA